MVRHLSKFEIKFVLFNIGWQPRYFVLNETGILSYYKSSELIHEGCKGSCLVLACEVKGKIIYFIYSIINFIFKINSSST